MLQPAADLERIGRRSLPFAGAFWRVVHRRVTTYELERGEFARVRESVDLTLSRALLDPLTVEEVGTFVPFGWLRRGALVGFDLRLGNEPVSMASAEQTQAVTRGLVAEALVGADELVARPLRDLAERLDDLASTPSRRERDLRAFAREHDLDDGPPSPLRDYWQRRGWLWELLATSFLAIAVLPDRPTGRMLVKYSSDIQLPAPVPPSTPVLRTTTIPLPMALQAASHHVDVILPEELRATQAQLMDLRADAPLPHADVLRNADRIAFYSRRDQLAGADPALRFTLVAEPRAFSLPAATVASALLCLLVAGWLSEPADLEPAATTILFAVSGAFVAIAQRIPASPLTRRLLVIPRIALVACGVIVLAAGAAVGLATGHTAINAVWAVALFLAIYGVGILVASVAMGSRRAPGGGLERRGAAGIAAAAAALCAVCFLVVALNPITVLEPAWARVAYVAAGLGATLYAARATWSFLVRPEIP